MKGSFGRRYAPLAAVVAIQLLIIALAPSKAPDAINSFATGSAGSGSSGSDFSANGSTGGATGADGTTDFSADGTAIDPATGQPVAGGDGGGGGAAIDPATGQPVAGGEGGGGGEAGAAGGGGAAGAQGGDTSHCVDGRQFDPAIDFYAPPCVPKFTGKNPGATYKGVTPDKIIIVDYVGKGSDAVDTILKAQGAYVDVSQRQAYDDAVEKFINDHYELYGRKVDIQIFEGNCATIPPDNACLRNEMRQIAADKGPFWFKWNASLSSETYDELSRIGIMNSGGWHFRDSFNQAHAPFHWDVQMSGTDLANHAGEWYCKQLKSFPTEYAGTGNPAENLNGKPRLLGVISTNDPENQASVQVDLKNQLAKCGASYGGRFYFYAQDITTADQQRRAAVLKMRSDGVATSIMCFCDLVAPAFLYAEEQQQNYYPENLVVGSGFMDADAASQAYMGRLGCPVGGGRPCNFEDAFGLSSIAAQEPKFKDAGSRVWAAAGGKGNPPYESVTSDWDYWNMIGSLIQMAGPKLDPGTVAQGSKALGCRGGGDTGHILRCFDGGFSWNQDMRPVYWSTQTASPYNGEAGSYKELGARIQLGGYPGSKWSMPGKPR